MINFFRSIFYVIVTPSKIYEYNQSTIKRFLEEIITPQARPLDVLVTPSHEIHHWKVFEMVDTCSTCNLLASTASLVAEKYSGISYTSQLECASTIFQGHNTTYSFKWKGLMDPPTSMITTAKTIRVKSRELYNVLHKTRAGKLRTKIFSLTTYTRLYYTQKYHALVNFFYHYDDSNIISVVGLSYRRSKIIQIFYATLSNLRTKSFFSPVSWMVT